VPDRPDPGVRKTSFYFPAELHRQLKILAAEEDTTLSELVVTAVTEWLAAHAPAPRGRRSR
jgi:aminoglycoside phosphotransferase (APT) family kinase protein